MIDKTLQEKILDAPLIIQNYVNNETECNYERYLTELLNHSEFFMQKSKGSFFKWVECQDHGEPDAVSKNYSIDYKLFVTTSRMHGLRVTSSRMWKTADGMITFGVGSWPAGKPFFCFRTVAALRQYSYEDLRRIADTPDGNMEKEISTILKELRVKKNLLLFYPYTMLFSEPHTFEEGCHSITEAFNEDLSTVGVYRRNKAPDYDTYLCVVYEKKLLIFELTADGWQMVDFVEMELSKTFTELFYTYGNNGFNF